MVVVVVYRTAFTAGRVSIPGLDNHGVSWLAAQVDGKKVEGETLDCWAVAKSGHRLVAAQVAGCYDGLVVSVPGCGCIVAGTGGTEGRPVSPSAIMSIWGQSAQHSTVRTVSCLSLSQFFFVLFWAAGDLPQGCGATWCGCGRGSEAGWRGRERPGVPRW